MKKILVLLLFCCTIALSLRSQQTVGVFLNDSLSLNGYTLFAPTSYTRTYLIDNCGNLVNKWFSSYTAGLSAYLLEDGSLLRAGRYPSDFVGGGTGGIIERYDWDGNLVWEYIYSSEQFHQHHDFEYLPNGNILILAWELKSVEEAIEAGRNPDKISMQGFWSEHIVEVQPIGTYAAQVVWEWHLWDHLVQDFDSLKANYGTVADHPELMDLNFGGVTDNNKDWVHFNAVDYNPELDQILLSSRHLDEIWIIDHSTTIAESAGHSGGNAGKGGDLLYRWGNPQSYRKGDLSDRRLYGQHDANWVPASYPGEGQIMYFNNGIGRPGGSFSSVETIQPPMDADGNYFLVPGETYGPENLSWYYQEFPAFEMYSGNISGAGRLPNGNTLICEGASGHFREVAIDGTLLWEYISPATPFGPVAQGENPIANNIFRSYRYAADYPGFEGKDLTDEGPLELEPLDFCMLWGDSVTAVNEFEKLEGLRIVANPVDDFLKIENLSGSDVQMTVFDLVGRPVYTGQFYGEYFEINASGWGSGLYLCRVFDRYEERVWIEKMVKK